MVVPLPPEVDAFLDMLVAERAAAVNTLVAYRRDLEDTTAFLAEAGLALPEAGSEDLRRYLDHLYGLQVAPRTVARRLSALRQFYRFMVSEGWRRDDPAGALDSPRQGRALPKLLDENEITALINAAVELKGPEGQRLLTVLEVLYATGMRVSELVELPLTALPKDLRCLIVRGKGDKERMVPLSAPARQALTDWLPMRSAFLPAGGSNRAARRRRAFDPSAPGANSQGFGDCGGSRPESAKSSRFAPQLRHSPARPRRRFTQRSENAGPRRYRDHSDLHPRHHRTLETHGDRTPPPGRTPSATGRESESNDLTGGDRLPESPVRAAAR